MINEKKSAGLVGIFDSGIGGLSVLREIQTILPYQPLYYIADQANVPYGKRQITEIRNFAFSITDFLAAKGANLIVVACNTASAAALNELRIAHPNLTFVGMEPAVKPASQSTINGVVGVLATPATFQGKLYNTLIDRFARNVKIFTHTCPGLVEAIEAGDVKSQNTRQILQNALLPMLNNGADTIVLGCTHFPFVLPLIKDIVGPQVSVIDPSPSIAKRVSFLLNQSDLTVRYTQKKEVTYSTSGDPKKFKKTIYSLLGVEISPHVLRWKSETLSEY